MSHINTGRKVKTGVFGSAEVWLCDGITVLRYGEDESHYEQVTARSQKHADRLARDLDWYSYSGSVGQAYGDLYYCQSSHRLVIHHGWDI